MIIKIAGSWQRMLRRGDGKIKVSLYFFKIKILGINKNFKVKKKKTKYIDDHLYICILLHDVDETIY